MSSPTSVGYYPVLFFSSFQVSEAGALTTRPSLQLGEGGVAGGRGKKVKATMKCKREAIFLIECQVGVALSPLETGGSIRTAGLDPHRWPSD